MDRSIMRPIQRLRMRDASRATIPIRAIERRTAWRRLASPYPNTISPRRRWPFKTGIRNSV